MKRNIILGIVIIMILITGCSEQALPDQDDMKVVDSEKQMDDVKEETNDSGDIKQDILEENTEILFEINNLQYSVSKEEFKFGLKNKGYETAILKTVRLDGKILNTQRTINNFAENKIELAEGLTLSILADVKLSCVKNPDKPLGAPHITGDLEVEIEQGDEIVTLSENIDVSCV